MENTTVVTSRDPQDLLRLLHKVAAISTLLILALSWTGISWVYQRFVISHAEVQAVSISQSIIALERDRLLNFEQAQTKGAQLVLDSAQWVGLDSSLRTFLTPYNILKIKVFSPAGLIIYSTDPAIIGQNNSNNARLAVALSGGNDSQIQTKDEVYDLGNEMRFDVDVVETYVPIRNEQNQVVGSFEIYQDTVLFQDEILAGVLSSISILAGILVTVFSIAYWFLRTAVSRLVLVQNKLQQLATSDGLTGLLNHREIIRLGENEFSRYIRQLEHAHRVPFSVIMADLDDFKQINDRYGHLDGDEVLRMVAFRINQQMRRYSIVGRYGGEEFLVILPEADSSEVSAVAQRICTAVEATPIALANSEVKVTLSLGVATVNGDDKTLEEVMLRADRALYQAKSDGKNRVGYSDALTAE
ncbi:MAG: GGDEF domain-containing protein [Halopseudomonas sp.]